MIDFEPAHISEITTRIDHLAIVFQEQVMFIEGADEFPSSYPLMRCELRVQGGIANAKLPGLPITADSIRVEYRKGSRRCFLPVGFSAEGPIHVYAELGTDLLLLAEGESVSLQIIAKVGDMPVTYEPPSND